MIAEQAYNDTKAIPFEDTSPETMNTIKVLLQSLSEITKYRDF